MGKEVHCEYKKIDRYKRKLAVCYLDKIDINKYMVRTGWAVAYKKFSSDYRNAEALAKKEKIGIWQWRFLFPETYRKKQRLKGIVYDNHR